MLRHATVVSWIVALVVFTLAGCSDDGIFGPQCSATWPCDPGYVCDMTLLYCVPDPDAGGDVDAADTGDEPAPSDTHDDDTVDTAVDDTSDTTVPDTEDTLDVPTSEICDNEDDDDLDGDTDCADSDCTGATNCVENSDRACDDGVDNDLDGDTDCEDLDCTWTAFCPGDCLDAVEPRGGECPEPFDAESDPFDGTLSFVNGLSIPPRGTDAECCFDFDADGNIDNGLALLVGALGVLGSDFDIGAQIAASLADGSIATVFEWGRGSTGDGFWVYSVTNDLDRSGGPDQAWATRAGGDGIFRIKAESLDEYGAVVQFNVASDDGSEFQAGPSLFHLSLPLGAGGFPFDLDLVMERATIAGEYTETASGRWSVNEEFDIDGEWVEFGGWKLGGLVDLDQIGALLNELAGSCDCAGFDSRAPVITYGDDGTQYNLACAQSPSGSCTAADGVICENIALVCSFLPSLPSLGLNDIDTDGNGVGDALSVGIRISATGAAFADPPVE